MPEKQKPFADGDLAHVGGILKCVRDGLCHRCGACVGFCPAGTFALQDGYPVQAGECVRCGTCVKVCSGLAVDYPALGRQVYGEGGYAFGPTMGPVRGVWLAAAAEPAVRRRGASGGAITQLLLHWLETGRIKGALVVVEDPDEPARGKGMIARTREDLLCSAQSRYTTAPSLAALREIRAEEGPFALVGLPCQIHALRQRQATDARWRARVPWTIGLFCHYNLPWESSKLAAALVAPKGERLAHANFRQRDERGWPDNSLEFVFTDGSRWRSPYGPAQTFNVMSRVSPLGRCLQCLDATAELADFGVGDPWIRDADGGWKYHDSDGWSVLVAHTARGEQLVREALAAGALTGRTIPAAEVERGQRSMMVEKKERTAFRLRVRRALGWPVPRYPMPLPATAPAQRRKELIFWFTRLAPVVPAVQRWLVRLGFSPLGGWLVRRRMANRKRAAQTR